MSNDVLRKLFGERIDEFMKKYSEHGVVLSENANFFGIESRGVLQVRGNGVLLLNNTDLAFGMFQPAQDFLFPLAYIEKVELVESHLNKTVFQPLLKILYTNEEGEADSVAWWVADPKKWKNMLCARLFSY